MSGPVQFGNYTLLRKIATGGMAEIFLAKQGGLEGIERFVVIKRILPHLTENPEFVRMFVDEMRIASFLGHPNIVQIYDIGAVGDQYYIAMEYLEGRDLRRIMRKAALRGEVVPLGFALRSISEVCEGLYYAHNRRDNSGNPLHIIHRDISPQNVMATVQGTVKLLDFGIAKAESQLNETRSGVLKGKYSYMSPEQALGRPLDPRSDIFSLGTILYELTTGRRLFKHDNEIVVLKMVAEADVPLPRLVDPGYPAGLERIVMRAMARNPDHRYLSARDLQADLQEFAVPARLMMSLGQAGEYLADLFADEREDLDPTSMPLPTADDKIISFLELPEEPQAQLSSSFPSLIEQNVVAHEEKSATGSLSILVQRARRRPVLTIGLGTSVAALITAVVLVLTIGLEQATSQPPTGPPHSLIQADPATPDSGPIGEVVSFGTIAVESTPPGAKIFIDGEEIGERAPTTIPAVTVGEQHFLVAEMEGKTAQARRITLEQEGDFKTLRFDFEQAQSAARVEFEGLPDDATVEIDGQGRARGNYDLEPSVTHTVAVSMNGRELVRRELRPGPGEVILVPVPEPPAATKEPPTRHVAGRTGTATIIISTQPPTTVSLGSKTLGTSPVEEVVEAGSYTLRLVNRSLLINYSESIRLAPGQRLQRTIALGQGRIRISARPFADVTVNGVPLGQTPVLKTLYAGTYSVVLTNDRLNKRERQVVRIREGSDERVSVDWR